MKSIFSNIYLVASKYFTGVLFIVLISFLLYMMQQNVNEATLTIWLLNAAGFLFTIINKIYTIILPLLIIFFSISIMLFQNPMYSLLALICVFFNVIFILLSIKVEFLSMIFLIIYIGAISILFLFVIMMFNLKNIQYNINWLKKMFLYSLLISIGLFIKFFLLIKTVMLNFFKEMIATYEIQYKQSITIDYIQKPYDILMLGNYFYTYFFELFIITGYILLLAMIGAIILAMTTNEYYVNK